MMRCSSKLSNIDLLSIGYLLVLTIVITPRCDGAGTGGAESQPDSGPLAGFTNLGNLANFGDAGAGLGSMFKSMTDGAANTAMLTDFMSSFTGPKVLAGAAGGSEAEKREGGNKMDGAGSSSTGLMDIKDPMDFFKMMLNPMEFMNRLAREFKLDRTEFTQAVGRGMNFGLETALQPPMVCIKIIEKVFVPDQCKLKFICDMGKQMAMFKGQMPKFPDSYFEGASTAKAIYDGASGRECEHVYACEEGDGPKLKKEFAGLKEKLNGGSSGKSDQGVFAAASQLSRVIAEGPKGVNKS